MTLEVDRDLPKRLKKLRLWDGSPLPADLHARLLREFERMQAVNRQIRALGAGACAADSPTMRTIRRWSRCVSCCG